MQLPRFTAGRCRHWLLACILLLLSQPKASAQSPFLETRAVWLATVLNDGGWPVIGMPATQQAAELRALVQRAHDVGINTFIMQVVARGDAMYQSTLLPWSALLAGPGIDPGFDPLAVAIDEAHRLGMELHAWMNVYRIGDTSTLDDFQQVSNPQHVGFAHPGWVAEKGSQVWLDPSADGAKDWLVSIAKEIVQQYDIDGIHFDFIRYPEGGFPNDQASFQFDNKGFNNIGDWRRGNVTAFVENAHAAITAIKPWVKIGSTPLGNYRETSRWPALWAYSEVYQESRVWLQNGWHDYLAPQIYFSIGTAPEGTNTWASPDFETLVNEWVDESSGRPIFAGYAAYKPAEGRFPASDLPLQIIAARDASAAGHAAFRYDHLVLYADLIKSTYEAPALPAAMTHRFEATAPTKPTGLILSHNSLGQIQLDWSPVSETSNDPLRSYVILRRKNAPPEEGEAADILASVNRDETSYVDIQAEAGTSYHYRIAARSSLGMISNFSESVSNQLITSNERPARNDRRKTTIVSVYPNPATQSATLTYYLASPTYVQIRLMDAIGRQATGVAFQESQAGFYSKQIDTQALSTGLYHVVLRTEAGVSSWPFTVQR